MSKSSSKQLYTQLKEWLLTLKHKRKNTPKPKYNKQQSRMDYMAKKQNGR